MQEINDYEKKRQVELLKTKMKIGAGVMAAVLTIGALVSFVKSPIISEGNFGVEKYWSGSYNSQTLSAGFNATLTSKIFEIYGKEILIKIEDVVPKDKDGIRLKDLDLTVAIKTNKENIVKFMVDKGDFFYDSNKGSFVVGMNYVSKEAKSVANQTIRKFSSEDLIDKQSEVENTFKEDLQKELNTLYGLNTFTVTDVKIANVQFSDSTQQKIEAIELIKSEEAKSTATEKILSIRNATLNKEVSGLQKIAKDNGVSFDQLMDYQKTKAISEGAANVQITTSTSSARPK